jgi:hypothetical protein
MSPWPGAPRRCLRVASRIAPVSLDGVDRGRASPSPRSELERRPGSDELTGDLDLIGVEADDRRIAFGSSLPDEGLALCEPLLDHIELGERPRLKRQHPHPDVAPTPDPRECHPATDTRLSTRAVHWPMRSLPTWTTLAGMNPPTGQKRPREQRIGDTLGWPASPALGRLTAGGVADQRRRVSVVIAELRRLRELGSTHRAVSRAVPPHLPPRSAAGPSPGPRQALHLERRGAELEQPSPGHVTVTQ